MNKKIEYESWNKKNNNFKKNINIKSNLIYGKFRKEIPKVSIMLITYKRIDGLKLALDSALMQDYKDYYEIVVVDDSGYDDKTDKLMKKYCQKYDNVVYYRHEKNLGQYANWNRACELCRTEWYCLLHDDDMLKENYLSETMKIVKKYDNIGLIGVTHKPNDKRENKNLSLYRRTLDKLINLFLKLRKGKPVNLTLKDNMKYIFNMNSTFINKNIALEMGGLDDQFFPSSDFYFSAKVATKYKTLFLPVVLVDKGIGDNESLKQSVCDDSIVRAYHLSYQIAEYLKFGKEKCKRIASRGAVYGEIGVKGYNDVDYSKIKDSLGIAKKYNRKITIFLLNLYSKFSWGCLLFRKTR